MSQTIELLRSLSAIAVLHAAPECHRQEDARKPTAPMVLMADGTAADYEIHSGWVFFRQGAAAETPARNSQKPTYVLD